MIIRQATINDADDIAHVHVESWRTAYKNLLSAEYLAGLSKETRKTHWLEILGKSSTNQITFVAEIAQVIVGFVSCGPERTNDADFVGEIYAIYLLQEYRRLGVGTALFRKAMKFLLEHGLTSVKIWTLRENIYRAFYERHGGKIITEKPITIDEAELMETAYGWTTFDSV